VEGFYFRVISQYAIPLLKKYIFPRAQESLVNTASEVGAGASLKSSLKRNSQGFLKNVVHDIVKIPLKGSGIKRKVKFCSINCLLFIKLKYTGSFVHLETHRKIENQKESCEKKESEKTDKEKAQKKLKRKRAVNVKTRRKKSAPKPAKTKLDFFHDGFDP